MKKKPIRILTLLLVLLFVLLAYLLWTEKNKPKDQSPETYTQSTPNQYQNETNLEEDTQAEEPFSEEPIENEAVTPVPPSTYLDVPFLVQAPNANWDARHEEACEEASLAMVNHYIKGTKVVNPDAELDEILTYQEQNGFKVDITISELNQIARDYFGLTSGRVINNASTENIQKELASGKPVIVPAAGKLLPNPNFRNGGPNYHMLVIKGYDEKGFITNDPGTRLGKDFRYTYSDLINAIHDWNESNILMGGKHFLVFD